MPKTDPTIQEIISDTLSQIGIPRMVVGNYTGDGSTSLVVSLGANITWTPKLVIIMVDGTAGVGNPIFFKTSLHAATLAQNSVDSDTDIVDNAVIALAAGSFTVDDAGTDSHPNKNTIVYQYIAFGW